ncbi:O-antigen ligase family protein [Ponticaulis profundi]|uniref:O-antigen ligase family protein n=1 Tax=Ponticaulis profundi TaxID=2665222 RepID=A0ABW1S711_9PROT
MPDSQTASRYRDTGAQAPARTFWRDAEKGIIVFCLLLFSQALLGRLFATEENPEGGAFLRFIWLPIYAYVMCQIVLNWRNMTAIVLRSPFLVALAVLSMASMMWSLDPGTSLRRGFAAICTTAFGFYLAATLSWKELLRCLGVTWLILAIGNFLAGALMPGFGIMHEIHVGAWRGLWFEKNAMGGHLARAAFLYAFLIVVDVDRRKLWGFCFLISLALVLLSTSKTSLLGLLLGIGVIGAYLWMRRGKLIAVSALWLGISSVMAVVLVVLVSPETVVAILGRDLTLTGRTDIWEVLFRIMEDRPNLGFGYGTFWAKDSPPAHMVRLETEWEVPTAHNGLIEIMLAMGRVGAAFFLIDFLLNIVRSLLTMHTRITSVYAFGFFIIFALFSISESVILQQNSITWVMYSAIAGKLALDARDRTKARRKAPVGYAEPLLKPSQNLRGRQGSSGRV